MTDGSCRDEEAVDEEDDTSGCVAKALSAVEFADQLYSIATFLNASTRSADLTFSCSFRSSRLTVVSSPVWPLLVAVSVNVATVVWKV